MLADEITGEEVAVPIRYERLPIFLPIPWLHRAYGSLDMTCHLQKGKLATAWTSVFVQFILTTPQMVHAW